MASAEKQLLEISREFQIYGELLHAEALRVGHINETYTATYDQGGTRVRYVHQKINQGVFKNPAAVMKNLVGPEEAALWPAILATPGLIPHLYGKVEARPGRKMGHVTRLFPRGSLPGEFGITAALGPVAPR